MIWKIIGVVLLLLIILFSVGIVYQNVPGEPVKMTAEGIDSEEFSIISYGVTPVFLDNLRFGHNNISYFINFSCSAVRRDAMVEAFDLFGWMMKYIDFYEVGGEANIDVECSDDFIMVADGMFAAGEGGPFKIINTSRFKVIEKGRIFLYDDKRCDYPFVELHELGHVFGFDHSDDPMNIMYSVSKCGQSVSADMIELLDALYAIEALPDVWISEAVAVKRGMYLDFNLTVLNEGLVDVDDVGLSIVVEGEVIKVLELGNIKVGFGRTIGVENLKLFSRDFDVVDFYVDRNNVVRELDEENNFVRMKIESS